MENSVKLSIIVPVYNAELYLEKCVKSLLSQNIKNLEIILVDDGSKDSSLDICHKLASADSRIRVFHQENSGQSKARNVGLDNASGEYVAFIDSDDWVDADYYEKLMNACIKYDADVSCASIIRERKHTRKFRVNYKTEKIFEKPQEKIDVARVPNMCYVWNKVYKKSFLESINLRFVEGMFFEDVDFVTRAVYFSNKLVTVPDTYYHYWTNGVSTVKTMRKSDKKCADSLKSKEMVLRFFKEHNLTSNPKYLIKRKTCMKLFGVTILKCYEWEARKVYYLFGAVPVFEIFSYA